jgi:hypothetical protein
MHAETGLMIGLISHPGIMMVSTVGLDVDISADALARLLVVTQSYMRRPSLLEDQAPVAQRERESRTEYHSLMVRDHLVGSASTEISAI